MNLFSNNFKYKAIGVFVGVVLFAISLVVRFSMVSASTNISGSYPEYFAWNDLVGWIDFYMPNTVTVTASRVEGYADSVAGYVSFDCATSPSGNICGTSNYHVDNNGAGDLSGWAWNDTYGWFSFYCGSEVPSGCGDSNYRVWINGSGQFQNYAWNDILGWVSFTCANTGSCATVDYKVVTSWAPTSTVAFLDSPVYDSGVSGGAKINSIIWKGVLPSGTSARFQLATSNSSSGPWTFAGADGTNSTYYQTDPDYSYPVSFNLHTGRYFRYRVTLISNSTQTETPRIDDVFINWSR